jgi:hypothetical protein
MVLVMADDSKKKNNPFAKVIGDLRVSREKLIMELAVKEERKKQQEEKEYQNWLGKAKEILVEDCLEAIRTITEDQVAEKADGSLTFTSEAFIWFRDNCNMILCRKKMVHELTSGEEWRILHDNGIVSRQEHERVAQISLHITSYAFSDSDLRAIFEKISAQLEEENCNLTTEDGVEFVLQWNFK